MEYLGTPARETTCSPTATTTGTAGSRAEKQGAIGRTRRVNRTLLVVRRSCSTDGGIILAPRTTAEHRLRNPFLFGSQISSRRLRPIRGVVGVVDPSPARTHMQSYAVVECRPRGDSILGPDPDFVRRQIRAQTRTPDSGPVPAALTLAPPPKPDHRLRARDDGAPGC